MPKLRQPLSESKYEACPKSPAIVIWREWFAQHRCNLAAKESGLECACVNSDDLTVLVSGGGRCRWVNTCTDWVEQWICIKFCVKLEHSFTETIRIVQKATAMGNWWLAASSRQCAPFMHHVLGKTSNCPGDSAPLHPRFGTLQLLAFPKTKTTFEREEISDCQWDSGKYDRAADGDWENYVRSQGAYFEGNWDVTVLCTVFLISCIFSVNVSIFHSAWLDTFWTGLVYLLLLHKSLHCRA